MESSSLLDSKFSLSIFMCLSLLYFLFYIKRLLFMAASLCHSLVLHNFIATFFTSFIILCKDTKQTKSKDPALPGEGTAMTQFSITLFHSRLLSLRFAPRRNGSTLVHRLSTVLILTACYLLLSTTAFSQYANIEFVENKGQWNDLVKFKGQINNGAFFLEEKGFRVMQHNEQDMEQLSTIFHGPHDTAKAAGGQLPKSAFMPIDPDHFVLRSHAYDVQFVNAQKPAIFPDKALPTYNNYISGDRPDQWKGNCKLFQAVTYSNMYAGVDVRYYTDNGLPKYDIIVQPGADIAQIALKYNGVDGLRVKNGELVIKTSVGENKEMAPYAYQIINGIKKEVACSFRVAENVVSFSIENYSKAHVLVIDPTLVFCTFTGSKPDNWGYTATFGPDGSFYAGGIVFGAEFPVSTGAYQSTFNGGNKEGEGSGYDIGIMKFNSSGSNRVYATYLGGSGNEQPHSLVVDAQGELVIAGRSNSINYPATGPIIGTGGDYDIVLTKLNAAGSGLIGSRRIGGAAFDGVNVRPKYEVPKGVETIRRNYGDDARSEVILDGSGNILLASNTQSAIFPTTAGAFQNTLKGRQDAVFIKMDATLTNLLVSTLLGGSGDDAAFVLAINPADNNIYFAGNTTSTDLPGDKTNVLNATFQGNTDGFVSIISPAGQLLKTTYVGTGGFDMLYGLQFDKYAFPYIMGTTTATWPVTSNVAFSQTGSKQFISKLKSDLSAYVFSTVFGTPGSPLPNISPVAFLVDRCENIYVSGWGGDANSKSGYPNAGTSGMSVTNDAIQRNTDNSDFYFFVLEKNAQSQLYGSFFGQSGGNYPEHVDGGTSRFDKNGTIYQAVCANCGGGATFPTTPGVWARTNGSVECNLAAIKIAFNESGVAGSIRSSIEGVIGDTLGCLPVVVNFADTLAEGKNYQWNFGDGSPSVITTTSTISHTYTAVGNYRVMLVSIDSQKCNLRDTAYMNIRVKTDKAILGVTAKKLEPCTAFNYRFVNNTVVSPPGKMFTNKSFTWSFGDNTPPVITGLDTIFHSFPGPGVYVVTLTITDTNFCNAPETLYDTLRIASLVKAKFETPLLGCAPYNAYFNNISEAGEQFLWNFGDGTISTAQYPTHLYVNTGVYTVKLIAIDSGTCNKSDSTTFTITVADKPTAAFNFSPDPPQSNIPIRFFNLSTGAVRYKWIFGDGDEIATTSTASVTHIYNVTNTFQAMLVAINASGCADTAMRVIAAKVLPLLDVPSAFTPNSDGANDVVMVRGFGIQKMTWKIYNRWGNVVFETNNRLQGWNGKYKGTLQPAEVYHYTLDVEYSDNTRYQKLGDITLLR